MSLQKLKCSLCGQPKYINKRYSVRQATFICNGCKNENKLKSSKKDSDEK